MLLQRSACTGPDALEESCLQTMMLHLENENITCVRNTPQAAAPRKMSLYGNNIDARGERVYFNPMLTQGITTRK